MIDPSKLFLIEINVLLIHGVGFYKILQKVSSKKAWGFRCRGRDTVFGLAFRVLKAGGE